MRWADGGKQLAPPVPCKMEFLTFDRGRGGGAVWGPDKAHRVADSRPDCDRAKLLL